MPGPVPCDMLSYNIFSRDEGIVIWFSNLGGALGLAIRLSF